VNELLKVVRRWLRSRQGRLVLVGAVAGATITGVAAAQDPTATAVAPAPTVIVAPNPSAEVMKPAASMPEPPAVHEPPPPAAAPTAAAPAPEPQHGAGVPFPTAHPPAEQAGGAAHGTNAPAHGGDGHAATGHVVHHPEAFNFADTERFRIEKEKAARGEKDAHGKPIVPVTPYAYLLINAGLLFALYYKFGKKPIVSGLQERHDTIAKELAEASRIKDEAEARAAEYQSKLERLEDELQIIKADIIKAGEADRARIVKEAEEKAERMKKDAQFLLDQELKQLRNDMIAFTAEAAVAAAESVLRAKVTSADHDRLNDEFLKEIATARSTAGGAS